MFDIKEVDILASGQTEWYGLSLWESGDSFLREEFNEDHRRIDEALEGKAEVVTGMFTGNGARTQDVLLGFTPKAVIVTNEMGLTNNANLNYGGIAAGTGGGDTSAVKIIQNGFQVFGAGHPNFTNEGNAFRRFLALT